MTETMTPTTDQIDVTGTSNQMETPSDDAGTREEKARTERMIVLPIVDEFGYATGEYLIISESGSEYTVDMDRSDDGEDCGCPDMQFNRPDNGCKHMRRVGIMMYETRLPQPDEPAEDYLQDFIDAEDDLKALKQSIENGEVEATEDEKSHVDRMLDAIDYIREKLPVDL